MIRLKKYLLHLVEPKILAIFLISLAICIILTMVFSQRIPEFKQKFRSKFYPYVLSGALIYTVIVFLGYNKLFSDNTLYEFIFYQVCSLVLGSIHCYMYRSYFQKFHQSKPVNEYLFALVTVCYTMIPFVLLYTFLNGNDFTFLMLGNYIVFFIPTLLNDTFNKAMTIPPKIYKTWQFPENYKELTGVSDSEMRNLVVFTLLMDKDSESRKYNVYRAKGPTRIDFGRLFYNFIEDYNERHAEDQIEIEGPNGLYSWVFFLQPKWYESTKYIDPDLTLHMNGIEENSVVFCMRVNETSASMVSAEQEGEPDFEYNQERDNQRVIND